MRLDLEISTVDIMNTEFISVHPKDSIKKAETIFKQINRKILPVVVRGELKGMLFSRDFINLNKTSSYLTEISGKNFVFGNMNVEDYMTTDFNALSTKSKLKDVINFFTKKRQYFIPILENKKILGFITPYDVFKLFIDKNNIEL